MCAKSASYSCENHNMIIGLSARAGNVPLENGVLLDHGLHFRNWIAYLVISILALAES